MFFAPLDWQPDEHTSLEPDALVIKRDRLFEKAIGDPELVVEVLSPSSARVDRLLKFARYAEGGIGHYWIADPGVPGRPPSVQVYDLVEGQYRLTGEVTGDERLPVTGPVSVTINPADLATG